MVVLEKKTVEARLTDFLNTRQKFMPPVFRPIRNGFAAGHLVAKKQSEPVMLVMTCNDDR
jgi:hypothetical protein